MNIFLIGYRGTGKTTLGKIISRERKMPFIDLDELIVKTVGKAIPQIFSTEGEAKFREYETNALKEVCEKQNQVISCGGGIVTREENITLLKKNGLVVLLKASPETIFNRIYKDKNRPALTDKDPMEEIKHMLEVRRTAYEKAKDFEVWTDKEKAKRTAERIEEEMKKRLKLS
ncbi:MAG: shikimate kinase [archaeon]|jgi:shikimate kinase